MFFTLPMRTFASGSENPFVPPANVGFGYVMNKMQGGLLIDTRVQRLIGALYESLQA